MVSSFRVGSIAARHWRALAAGFIFCGVAACTGQIGPGAEGRTPGGVAIGSDPGKSTGAEPLDCTARHVAPGQLLRLTRSEYNNTVRDLLGDMTAPASKFASDDGVNGFSVGLTVSPVLVEQQFDSAEALAAAATSSATIQSFLACKPITPADEDACATRFIAAFGQRAFRRPLDDGEKTSFKTVYDAGRVDGDFTSGIELVIQALLESPSFLYHFPAGPQDGNPGDVVAVSDWEMASRLSYFVWNSMPDDILFAAAERGALRTPDQIMAQVDRMMQDRRAVESVSNFYRQWLALDGLQTLQKDARIYASFVPTMGPDLERSMSAFLDDVIWTGDAKLRTLLTSHDLFVNGSLAALYGIPGIAGDEMQKVAADPAQRSGILSQPALLALLAKPGQSDPIHRGLFVIRRFLCQTLPPPPPNVSNQIPTPSKGTTTRAAYAASTSNPSCKGCHGQINPMGFGFEAYDGIGAYRTVEDGAPVDASGEVVVSQDVNGPFNGIPELAARLAGSTQVENCMASQWLGYALARQQADEDACSNQQAAKNFGDSGGNLKSVLAAVIKTDSFMYKKIPGDH